MIRLIIMDLDGVLIDAREIHYEALNEAISKIAGDQYVISRNEHLSVYDGLNTNTKLDLLTNNKGLPLSNHREIFKTKQTLTLNGIKNIPFNQKLYDDIEKLKIKYKLCVASNSIRSTVNMSLVYTKLINHFEFFYSNEDVSKPKPNTEIYLQCMIRAGVSPKETLIIEDSYNGRLGAEQTGAFVMGVNSPKDVTYENIIKFIEMQEDKKIKWKDPNLNILIPMNGLGSRFEETGKYCFPKPLIEVFGKPMIQLVVESLNIDANYIFIVRKEHYEKYNLKTMLNLICPHCKIIVSDVTTEGAACTSLLAKEYISNDHPLLIVNSDQYIKWDSGQFMYNMIGEYIDGGIAVFESTHPKWSFVKTNNGFVTSLAEKNPISNIATCGVYFWKKGSEYVKCAEEMIRKNIRTNNEFYIAPVYNELILKEGKIKTFYVEEMHGLGDPQSLDIFISNYKYGQKGI